MLCDSCFIPVRFVLGFNDSKELDVLLDRDGPAALGSEVVTAP